MSPKARILGVSQRRAAARSLIANPSAPPEALERLANGRSSHVSKAARLALRERGDGPGAEERVRLMSADEKVRAAIYSDDPDILRALAVRPSVAVAYDLARNPHAPPDALDLLADDVREQKPGRSVARRVSEHPSTPDVALRRLALSSDIYVRQQVSKHPNASEEAKASAALLGTTRPRPAR